MSVERVERVQVDDDRGADSFTLPEELAELLAIGFGILSRDGDAIELSGRLGWLYHWSCGLDAQIEDVCARRDPNDPLLLRLSGATRTIREAVGGLAAYVESNNKSDLALALHLLESASSSLVNEVSTASRMANSEFSQFKSNPESLHSRSYQLISSIVSAYHDGVPAQQCVDRLRMLIRNGEQAATTLNVRVRSVVLEEGADDLDILMSYEQLSVITEHHLNGLRELESALYSGSDKAVDQCFQGLAEIDTYLLEFQESSRGAQR